MEIKLYNDIVFKWIFGRQEQTRPLIHFLNSVICYEGSRSKFSEVRILNPYDKSEPFKKEKQGILDIRAKDVNTNEWIDLEVQVKYNLYYPQRSKYYLAGMYRDQLEKNKENNYHDLSPCYGIHVLVDTLFEDENVWFNHYAMLNTRTYKPLVDHWHLYYIELNKFLSCYKKQTMKKKCDPGQSDGRYIDEGQPQYPVCSVDTTAQADYVLAQSKFMVLWGKYRFAAKG